MPTTTTGATTSSQSPARPTTQTAEPQVQWPTHDVSRPFRGTVPPAPTVTAIRAGTHPEVGYDRIVVELDTQPGYRVGYQPRVVRDGSGLPIQLSGRAFLQNILTPAQAQRRLPHHDADESGESVLPLSGPYVVNGDFEGHVSVALGLVTDTQTRDQ